MRFIFLILFSFLFLSVAHAGSPIIGGHEGPTFLAPAILQNQTSTPSDPDSGYTKLYIGSDGKLYRLQSDGTSVLIDITDLNSTVTTIDSTYVAGPATSTDSAIAVFDGTTGKLLKNSSVTISGSTITGTLSGNVTGNLTGNVAGNLTGDVTGNADTASNFDHSPLGCSAHNFATAIDSGGNLACALLAGSDLPFPSLTTIGGIEAINSSSHEWIDSISTLGVPHLSQPDFSDLTGSANLTSQISGLLPKANGGFGADMSAVTLPTSGTYLSDSNSVTGISNKAFVDPITNAVDFTEQSSTPLTPSSGVKKMYCKNDGICYTLDSSGNEVPLGSGSGGVYSNLLTNGDFSQTTSGWTASGGTFTTVTSGANYMGVGKNTATWDSSASAQTLTSPSYTIANGYAGTNGLYRCKVWNKSGATTTMGTWDGTTLANTITIPSGTTAQYVEIMAPFGSAGTTTAIRFTSVASDEPLISIDDCYVGPNFEVGTVAQAILIGQIKITGCAALWSTAATSLTAFSAQTGCTYTVLSGSGVSAPSTNIPGIKFSSLPPGNFVLKYQGTLEEVYSSAAANASFQFYDGTNSANEISYGPTANTNINAPLLPGFQQTISYSTAQSNITLQIRGASSSSSSSAQLSGTNANPGVISVYYFPTQSQQSVRMDATPASWSGYESGAQWTTASASFVDGTVSGTPTITQLTARNMTCSQSGTLSAISCNLPRSGNYEVCFNTATGNATSGNHNYIQLTDGTTAFGFWDGNAQGANSLSLPLGACAHYLATSSGTVIFKSQIKTNAATNMLMGSTASDIRQMWSVTELDAPMGMPYLTGGITSNTSGQERIERARLTSVCSSGTCTIADGTSGISSITWSSTGHYTVNFTAGNFSSAPTCQAQDYQGGAANGHCDVNGAGSTSSENIICVNNSGSAQNTDFNVICMGPR